MKISIITVCFNSAQTIENTIQSVLNQKNVDIEYIIIDGASTDHTLDIVKNYKDKITTIVSEKDTGIYNAMNKGIVRATGDIVGILNSDDVYASDTILATVVTEFQSKSVDCIWGDLVYVNKNTSDTVLRYWKSSPYIKGIFQKGWHPPHPSFFVKKEIYIKYGLFREDLFISADYELMLRFLERYAISFKYVSKVFVRMRVGGKSNKNFLNIIKGNFQCFQAFKLNNIKVSPIIFFIKPFLKLFQFTNIFSE